MREVREAIRRAELHPNPIDLSPQEPQVRRLQHELIETHTLRSRSFGSEPERFVRIYGRDKTKVAAAISVSPQDEGTTAEDIAVGDEEELG
jgi:hypothetical protein